MAEEQRKKRRRRRRGGRSGFFAGVLMLVVIAVYTPALLKWFFTDRQETAVIRQDVLEVRIPVEGVFLRSETLLTAPGDGILMTEAQNGDRVARNGLIGSFVGEDRMELIRQYRAAEQEILTRVVENPGTLDPATASLWKEQIEKQVVKLVGAANAGDLGRLGDARGSVDRVLEDRARVLLEGGSGKTYLESERQELEVLKSRMADSMQEIRAEQPGLVCYATDGLETSLTPDRRDTLTAVDIDAVVAKDSEALLSTPSELVVGGEEPFGRLVQNDQAWFVFKFDAKQSDALSKRLAAAGQNGSKLKMNMQLAGSNDELPVVVTAVRGATEGEAVAVAQLTKNVELTAEIRKSRAELVMTRLEGLKVPVGSLLDRNTVDGTADIVLVKMDRASIRRVQVTGEQDGWAIVENLPQSGDGEGVSVFDVYLVEPEGVVEGQVINR